ncbi:hypothetical protein AX17_002964 [Amanita inopinata Kibby_2008]|nr:hypothetical protein AX17_002964 [Amanita inopinata Kibby_2008]
MVLLNAFNGKVNITEAFAWNSERIRKEFDDMLKAMGPDGYNVEANSQSSFKQAVADIKNLVGRKTMFLDKLSKYKYQGVDFELETLYDIVGWIFSVTGTTPANSNNQNYYWPLGALYFVFCRRLIANEDKEPHIIQLTYFAQANGVQRVAVGATLDRPKQKRKEVARLNRAKRMIKDSFITEAEINVSYVLNPDGSELQKFGHCGESFPCMFIKSLPSNVSAARGFAAKAHLAFLETGGLYDETKFVKELENPCENCKILIRKAGMNPDHFLV